MLQIRSAVICTSLGITTVAILAQTGTASTGGSPPSTDNRVLNAPYSAQRRFTSIEKSADGTSKRSVSGGSEARDSQGRAYSAGERHWTYLEGNKSVLGSELLYRNHDPVAKTDTSWDTTSKVVKVTHWPQSIPKEDASGVPCQAGCFEPIWDKVEKLGATRIEGVAAEGTRSSYTVPAGQDKNDKPIVVVHESWYCPELKVVVLETNDDPRSGTTRNELVDIVRGEPDVTQYKPPASYAVRDVYLK